FILAWVALRLPCLLLFVGSRRFLLCSSLSHPPSSPDISTLSYTTLFRSSLRGHRSRRSAPHRRGRFGSAGKVRRRFRPRLRRSRAGPRPARRADGRDRKSTRLNSSHLGISYAVFCLKKKNNHNKTANNTI